MRSVNVVVLNYNGMDFLPESLPTLVEACRRSAYPCRLSVIDNESTDKSVAFIKQNYPSIPIYPYKNRILCSFNQFAREVSEDVCLFLNNDIKVDADFINPLMQYFDQAEDIFLVCPKIMHYDGLSMMGGASRAWMSWGLPKSRDLREAEAAAHAGNTFSAGCALAVDRKKFLELEGYDEIYLPGTVEDMDLSFRAWRSGYRCLYEPKSRVYHKGQAIFHKKFGRFRTAEMNARNIYLFVWKNIGDRVYLFQHILFLPLRLAMNILRFQWHWVSGFFKALRYLPEALSLRRKTLRRAAIRSDREIFSVVTG